jgi:hypothetical protein
MCVFTFKSAVMPRIQTRATNWGTQVEPKTQTVPSPCPIIWTPVTVCDRNQHHEGSFGNKLQVKHLGVV